jgi:hypothetical protein
LPAQVRWLPTITIASDFDGAASDGTSYAKQFSGKYSHRILKGIGRNVPQEAPQAFAAAVVEVDGYRSALACLPIAACSTQRTHRSSAAGNPPAGASNRFSPRQMERLSITIPRKTRIKRVGRRETGRSLPSTTKSLRSRQTSAIHQVNLVVSQA